MKKLLTLLGAATFAIVAMSFSNHEKKVILVDVGHGGADHGAQIKGFTEKEITLQFANKLKEIHADETVEIVFTRDGDRFLTQDEKQALVKKVGPSIILSLHANLAPNENLSGMVIYHSNDDKVGALALPYAEKLKSNSNEFNYNTTIKSAGFQIFKLDDSIPTLLIELGFLSNDDDLKLLSSEEGQTQLATAILEAIK